MATPEALGRLDKYMKEHEAELAIQSDLLTKNLGSLKDVVVTLSKKANEKGHLFDSIHKDDLVSALKEQAHVDMIAEFIDLSRPIKEVGEHEVSVKVSGQEASFKVVVEAL
jgi:ribosomal protein L9